MTEHSFTLHKRRSKEYKQYINNVINEYNTNGKKTVLLTCDSYFPIVDGVVNVIDNYAKLLSNDMNVMMLVPDYKGNVYMNGSPAIGIASAFSKRLNYQIPLPMFDMRYRQLLKKLRIDIIHCHSPFTVGRVAMKLHKQRHIPLVTTFHSLFKYDFETHVKPLANFMLKYIVKCYNNSDEVWTMNDACAKIIHEYGYKGDTFILPHGVSTTLSSDYTTERNTTRMKFGVDDGTLLFIFVGRLVVPKNIHFILEVLSKLKQRNLHYKMLIVGDGPERKSLQKHTAQLELNDEVEFVGSISDRSELTSIYAAADMLLFPSYYDTFALVKVEAASRYTPTAFIDNCPACSTVEHGTNGYIFPQDVDKFADGVYNAVMNRDKLKTVGLNANRDLYVTWQDIIPKVVSRYNKIIESNTKIS